MLFATRTGLRINRRQIYWGDRVWLLVAEQVAARLTRGHTHWHWSFFRGFGEAGQFIRREVNKVDRFDKCWEIKRCNNRETCRVFPHFGRSCWLIRAKLQSVFCEETDVDCAEHCESCDVYQWHLTFLKIRGQRFTQLSK